MRKVKCDRAEPTCGWCSRNGRVCEYKERKKPGLRANYGRELESKIGRLEALLQAQGRRLENYILDHPHGPDTPRSVHQPPDVPRYSDISRSTAPDVDSQSTPALNSPWPQASPYERMQYQRPPDTMSVQSMVGNTLTESFAQPDRPQSAALSTAFTPPFTLSERETHLPPPDLLYTLVDLYFKHVNTWSPIIDRKVTFDTLFGSSIPHEADRVLLHAIVATTLRFSKDPRLTPESRKLYHGISKQKVQLYGLEHTNVRALQALVILALDVLGTSNGPQGRNMLALIARSIVQLGLHVEKSVSLALPISPSIATLQESILPEPQSWIENEERRRLCWMIYVLDRYTTVATTLDFTLNEKEMALQLPCRYDLFSQNQPVETRWFRRAERSTVNKPENLGSFSYHCEVLRILSRIHKFLNRPLDIGSLADVERWQVSYRELDGELNTWLDNLPSDYGNISQLCHSDPSSKISNWIMLHAAFHTSVIRLHSSAAYPIVRSLRFVPSYNAMQRCLAAVESLREIAQDVVNTGMLDLLGPPFSFSLWVSASLLFVHGSTVERFDPNIGFFISTLEQMGQYWEAAQRYAQILDRVLQDYRQNKPSAALVNIATSPNANLLAAMRR